MFGVRFGDKHSFYDFGLIYSSKTIGPATPQTKLVEVPGRNGPIDMTEVVSGCVKYEARPLSVTFYTKKTVNHYQAILSELQNYLQGQKMKIIFDDDIAFYWIGRPVVDSMECDGSLGKIVISAVVDPYKYTVQSSMEDWLWDPFDFEQSIINELAEMKVNGSLRVEILGEKKYANPIIIASNAMTVDFEGSIYNVKQGSQVMYDIILKEGSNILIFEGNGTVSINYVGGSL